MSATEAPAAAVATASVDRSKLRERVERIRADEAARDEADRVGLQSTLATLLARAEQAEEARKGLPCYGLEDEGGAEACEATGARASCPFAAPMRGANPNGACARLRVEAAAADHVAETERRIEAAGIEAQEAAVLLAWARREKRPRATAALTMIRSWLERETRERLVFLAGPTGVGKTLAACYALARRGGTYTKAARVIRPGFDLASAERAPLLVVDQFGREHVGMSDFGLLTLEDLIDTRYAARRPTILCGNLTQAQFDARYQDVIADRFRGSGLWVQLDGDSLRGAA